MWEAKSKLAVPKIAIEEIPRSEYSTQMSQTPQVSYLTTDHLGSPRVVTNENGVVTSRKDFTAFGEQNYTAQRTETLGYEPDTIRKGYTGYEKDDESGLDFAQARYYNASHGRYTSVDPLTASASIKNPQTFNRYSYVLNSPYKFTDPLGLLPLTSAGACGNFCPNSGPTVDGSAIRGRDATFDWTVPDITLPNVIATSLGANGTVPITKDDRKALQKNLRKLVPGTRVSKDGRITIPGVPQNTPGYRLLSGIGQTGQQLTIVVNHVGENSVDTRPLSRIWGHAAGAIAYWDPNSPVMMEERINANQIKAVEDKPEVGLAHELIHAYNSMRPYPNAFMYSRWGNSSVNVTHYFTEGSVAYSESWNHAEFRVLGYFDNLSGDVTENQIRSQLGYRPRATYRARQDWTRTN